MKHAKWYRDRNAHIAKDSEVMKPFELSLKYRLDIGTIKTIIREEEKTMAGKVGNRWCSNPTTVLGHIELEGVPKEDYSDYHVGQTFPPYDVTCMLRNGSFTPGLILNHNGKRVIVVGQDHNQKFEEM